MVIPIITMIVINTKTTISNNNNNNNNNNNDDDDDNTIHHDAFPDMQCLASDKAACEESYLDACTNELHNVVVCSSSAQQSLGE